MTSTSEHESRDNYCGARKRQGEGTCRRPAGWGTDHVGFGNCKLHLGNTRNGRKAGAELRLDSDVRTMLLREELEPVDDPLSQLQLLAAEILKLKEILADKVEELSAWSYNDANHHEDIRAVLAAYERALDRSTAILTGMARLNIEERVVRIDEARAQIVVKVIERVLTLAGLNPQAIDVRSSVAHELALVTG